MQSVAPVTDVKKNIFWRTNSVLAGEINETIHTIQYRVIEMFTKEEEEVADVDYIERQASERFSLKSLNCQEYASEEYLWRFGPFRGLYVCKAI
jgi:hypothetical protein